MKLLASLIVIAPLAALLLFALFPRVCHAVARAITLHQLTRMCGSRARANRLVRAVELETRSNALSDLVRSSVSPRRRVLADALGRSARHDQDFPPAKLIVGSVTR